MSSTCTGSGWSGLVQSVNGRKALESLVMDEERAEADSVVVTVQEVEMDAGFRFLVRFASGLEKTSRMICDNMK